MIEVQGLRHCFGRREVLRDLTFSLEKGGFAFLTGPSGAGKSTLLRILHGSLPLQEGRAVAAGHDLAGLRPSKLHQLRRDVAMVFQDFKILPERSVADNVALPLVVRGTPAARIKRRVSSALTALRLTELANRPCAELAGGEQQRVAIARAVVTDPTILVADEPTGDLDRYSAEEILNLIDRLNREAGKTIIMVTHDPRAAEKAHIIRYLEKGILSDVSA